MIRINKFTLKALSLLIFPISTLGAFAQDFSFFGIGAELTQDPFSKKTAIIRILPDSPAQKANLSTGGIILEINGEKAKKFDLCQITSKIRGEEGTTVKLLVKESFWKKKTYEITRGNITVTEPDENEHFTSHWRQIAHECFTCEKFIPKEAVKQLSRKYKKTLLPKINYWAQRKCKFRLGYDTCMKYSQNQKEACLINLLNRENSTTNTDKKLYKVLREKI